MSTRGEELAERLIHQDHFEPDDLATLLEMDVSLIRHAAFAGELKATVVDHHIVSIRREDVLAWLAERG